MTGLTQVEAASKAVDEGANPSRPATGGTWERES